MIEYHDMGNHVLVSRDMNVALRKRGRKSLDVRIRIDGRGGVSFRVDNFETFVWVAIDGGEGFRTLDEAKAYAERWYRAACEQETIHPQVKR